MPLVVVGTVLLLLKLFEIDPVTGWSWLWILAPFGIAVAWWIWADSTGLTQRRAIARMEQRKQQRRERDIDALGLSVRGDRRKRASKRAADSARQGSQAPMEDPGKRS